MCEKIVLSKRLKAVASFVSQGSRICDVGCDHGFIPIYLLQHGIAPSALAMDVREGPLQQAREHVIECGLEEYITLRKSDGLCNYRIGEADTLICAGMGGRLMMRILEENTEKASSFQELILQPQSDIEQFRFFLRRQDYLFLDENMIEEDGKFYPMMKVVPGKQIRRRKMSKELLPDAFIRPVISEISVKNMTLKESFGDTLAIQDAYSRQLSWQQRSWHQRIEDRYGSFLLQKKHPVLYRYLEREMRIYGEILEELRGQDEAGSRQGEDKCGTESGKIRRRKRYREVEEQMRDCRRVMELFLK